MSAPSHVSGLIAFQGQPGAYSDLACRHVFPGSPTFPCQTFDDTFAAVHDGEASLAMVPVENSVAGRVADIHHLLPDGGLHIIGEYYQRINHHLLVLPGTKVAQVRTVRSHIQALSQCRGTLRRLGIRPVTHADTAGAAEEIARLKDPTVAAIASSLAGEIYNLESALAGIEDHSHNTTRFLILARDARVPEPEAGKLMTSFVFRLRSVPAALYKALGGFATNGVNLTKLESYMLDGRFTSVQFYADVEGHPEDKPLRLALEELGFFAQQVKILGVYPAHPFRLDPSQAGEG